MRFRFAICLALAMLAAGCTARKVEVEGIGDEAAFYCEGSLSAGTLWISGRPLVFGPDSLRDYVSDLRSQNAAVVYVVGDTLKLFLTDSLSVPPRSSVPYAVEQTIVAPYELKSDSLAPDVNRTKIIC